MPSHYNPADFLLELVNVDFETDDRAGGHRRLEMITSAWVQTSASSSSNEKSASPTAPQYKELQVQEQSHTTKALIPITLLHRNFIKSYRDVVAYGIRIAMYIGLSLL